MCMRYETAAILFHEEDGDFSLWTVDFLFENEGQFSLCTMNMDKAFLWDYQHEGSSVRGSREDIVEELGDFFYCQAATPEEVMM